LDQLTAQGITATEVDCEDVDFGFPDFTDIPDDIDFDDFDFDIDSLDLACIEVEIDGEVSIISVTVDYLQDALDGLAFFGITATEVDCDDGSGLGFTPIDDVSELVTPPTTVTAIDVFPNPVILSSQITVKFESQREELVRITVSNGMGITSTVEKVYANEGLNQVQINTNGLEAGLYTIAISNSDAVLQTEKLMIRQ